MRFPHELVPWAGDFALELADKTQFQSEYDSLGNLSHLVAHVPRDEFFKLYPTDVFANVYWRGLSMQFSGSQNHCRVYSRNSGLSIDIQTGYDEECQPVARFWHKNDMIAEGELRTPDISNLVEDSIAFQSIVKLSYKTFDRIQNSHRLERSLKKLPCIHIIPESVNAEEFDSAMVLLQ